MHWVWVCGCVGVLSVVGISTHVYVWLPLGFLPATLPYQAKFKITETGLKSHGSGRQARDKIPACSCGTTNSALPSIHTSYGVTRSYRIFTVA